MRHHNEHDEHTVPVQPLAAPPAPPQLMRLAVHGPDGVQVHEGVVEWSTVPPHTFQFKTLDGEVRLFDMPGRDFVLRPQDG